MSTSMKLNELTLNNIPSWPPAFRFIALLIIVIVCLGLGYQFLLADQWKTYQREVAKEQQLKTDYKLKYQTAVNLPVYREQLEQLNRNLETLLDMLPTDDETARLLDDITLVGTRSGLEFNRIEWLAAQPREFYTALPIQIELEGNYHQLGEFIGQIAGLHRIINVKDFSLRNNDLSDDLSLSITAETYRQQTLRAEQ